MRLRLLAVLPALFSVCTLFAASAQTAGTVDDNDTIPVPGKNVHPDARSENDRGAVDPNTRLDRMILVLSAQANATGAIDDLLVQLNDPASPRFHQWLTPQQFGQRFGRSDGDVAGITAWLERNGFTVESVADGRGAIIFSGTAGAVERALKTPIHSFEVNGKTYTANTSNPQVPRAFAGLIEGIATLHNFPRNPMNRGFKPLSNGPLQAGGMTPNYTSGSGNHYLAPADFATIYNVNPRYTAGNDGTGQTIAIVGRTDIALADVRLFRSTFGLPANDPVFVHNGSDPGDLGGGEEGEADLDVEWAGAVAKKATIKFVISASTSATDGVDLSAQYIVNNNLASVMSTSFGSCESDMGTTENTFYNNLWRQAATQGISAFVASGDSGAAGCNGGGDLFGSGKAVSGLASTPYDIAVGGSQFNDTANPSAYWSGSNNSTTKSSALGYIPEIAWNESADVAGGSGLWASAGGVSTIYAKPSWQAGVGVPADGRRDVPDVALAASGHDGYLVIQGQALASVGGTSASSPSFAGLMALIDQSAGSSQGQANTKFYSLANAQYSGLGVAMFHDVTIGNNSVPGVTGGICGPGYDLVTGVGTVDANALITNWQAQAPANPTNVAAAVATHTSVLITWTAPAGAVPSRYHVYRTSNGSNYTQVNGETTTATTFTDTSASANLAYLYKVRSVDASGNESGDSNLVLATMVIFTDPALTTRTTAVKAVHLTELRTAVTAVCTLAGNPSPCSTSFTDPTLTAGVPVKAAHLNELRTKLNAAVQQLGFGAFSFTDTITHGWPIIKAIHIIELRNDVN